MTDKSQVERWAMGVRERLKFSSERFSPPENNYVAWVDLMGAGHLMATSIQKSANFLARLHMAIAITKKDLAFSGTTIAINDGVYLMTPVQSEIQTFLTVLMARLSGLFLCTHRAQDRCLVRSGIAYGPVYTKTNLWEGTGVSKRKTFPGLYDNVAFGPPIIQAYKSEQDSPPYGVAVHESARSFSEPGTTPFRMTHWLWWQHDPNAVKLGKLPGLHTLKDELRAGLEAHFAWMESTQLLQGLPDGKVDKWRKASAQYFSLS